MKKLIYFFLFAFVLGSSNSISAQTPADGLLIGVPGAVCPLDLSITYLDGNNNQQVINTQVSPGTSFDYAFYCSANSITSNGIISYSFGYGLLNNSFNMSNNGGIFNNVSYNINGCSGSNGLMDGDEAGYGGTNIYNLH